LVGSNFTFTNKAAAPLVVEKVWYDLYSFIYVNFDHVASNYESVDDLGRMLVITESQYQDGAQKFVDWKKTQGLKDVVLKTTSGSASSDKSAITKMYNEADSLSYVVLYGKNVPTFNCPKSRYECDCQFADMSNDNSPCAGKLSIFVSRIAGGSKSENDAQVDKFMKYDQPKAAWMTHTAGLALNLMGDEYRYMQDNLNAMKQFGFTQSTFMKDQSASSSQVEGLINGGLGIFYYIGHGSGTKWNCPQHTGGISQSDVHALTNDYKNPFILDCSCLNGGFKSQRKCFAGAMVSEPKHGGISMYSSAPEATSSSPKDCQKSATDLMVQKKATRVGPIYFGGMMAAYVLHPSQCLYTMQGYNMFGDPSLQLNFLK
jgi:hypothetical protein